MGILKTEFFYLANAMKDAESLARELADVVISHHEDGDPWFPTTKDFLPILTRHTAATTALISECRRVLDDARVAIECEDIPPSEWRKHHARSYTLQSITALLQRLP